MGAMQKMREYRWPGNVRELKNVIERAVVLSQRKVIEAEELVLTSLATASESFEFAAAKSAYTPLSLTEIEKRHIVATLTATKWNKSQASSILGIERSTLDRKIRKYDIQRPPTD